LLSKPEIVVLNKIDLFASNPEIIERAREALLKQITQIRGAQPLAGEPFIISAVSGAGIDSVLGAVWREIETARRQGT
jgi:50S ribosomal subunit-associated GTPase HflX